MKVLQVFALSAAFLAPLAPVAALADVTPVQEVNVKADVTTIKNEGAALFWGNVERDLESAIMLRVADRMAEKGSRITVNIDGIALSSSFETAMGEAGSSLVGNVTVASDDNSKYDAYELTITSDQARGFVLEDGFVVPSMADASEHYRALINAFAKNVVERLK